MNEGVNKVCIKGCSSFCINTNACMVIGKCIIKSSFSLYPCYSKKRKKYLNRIKNCGNDTEQIIKQISYLIKDTHNQDNVENVRLTKFEKLCIENLNKPR